MRNLEDQSKSYTLAYLLGFWALVLVSIYLCFAGEGVAQVLAFVSTPLALFVAIICTIGFLKAKG